MLEEAYDLFAALRLEHQVRQLEAGASPTTTSIRSSSNPLTRRYLRDAFREVAAVQRSLVAELDRTGTQLSGARTPGDVRLPVGLPARPLDPLARSRLQRCRPRADRSRSFRPTRSSPTRRSRSPAAGFAWMTHAIASSAQTGCLTPTRSASTGCARATSPAPRHSSEVLDDLLEALTGRVLVAHAAAIEEGFLACRPRDARPEPCAIRSSTPPARAGAAPASAPAPAQAPSGRVFRHRGLLAGTLRARALPGPTGTPTPSCRRGRVDRGTGLHRPGHPPRGFKPQTVGSLQRLSAPKRERGRRPSLGAGCLPLSRRAPGRQGRGRLVDDPYKLLKIGNRA